MSSLYTFRLNLGQVCIFLSGTKITHTHTHSKSQNISMVRFHFVNTENRPGRLCTQVLNVNDIWAVE